MATTKKKTKSKRRKRPSFASLRRKTNVELTEEVERDYVCRWINDTTGRIDMATRAGYEFVTQDELLGSVGDGEVHGDNRDLNSRVSLKTRDGNGEITAYLMKIRREFYEEDLKEKAAVADEVDAAIVDGTAGGASVANQYGEVRMNRR